MTDRNLLRAQLLIEAADLLDEGYNKPNTNDKIKAAEIRMAANSALHRLSEKEKNGEVGNGVLDQAIHNTNKEYANLLKLEKGNPLRVARDRSYPPEGWDDASKRMFVIRRKNLYEKGHQDRLRDLSNIK